MEQVKHIGTVMEPARSATCPMGVVGQRDRRAAERTARMQAMAFAHWVAPKDEACAAAADRLGLRPSTLARWDRRWRHGRMPAAPLGRPQRPVSPIEWLDVVQHIEVLGPGVGLSPLRAMFPQVARSHLRDAQVRFRRQWPTDHGVWTEVLTWTTPGAVWAGDFTDPPTPIDGCFKHILATRDLGSYMHLLAHPAANEDAAMAWAAARSLFLTYGAPLVYKLDNGSAFISGDFRALLENFGVTLLLSPARLPRYNGSAEAGNGSLKTRMHYQAVANGRGSEPTSDDVEAARAQLNHTLRPWGPQSPTPMETWLSRKPITPDQRAQFRQCVAQSDLAVRGDLALGDQPLEPKARAVVARAAIRRALVALGYLFVQRKRITPPFNSPLRDKIT